MVLKYQDPNVYSIEPLDRKGPMHVVPQCSKVITNLFKCADGSNTFTGVMLHLYEG